LSALLLALGLLHGCSPSNDSKNRNATGTNENRARASVWLNDTADFFNGDLAISLIDTKFDPSLKVYATIHSDNFPEKKIAGEQVGFNLRYKGIDIYTIMIHKVQKERVWFDVTRERQEPAP